MLENFGTEDVHLGDIDVQVVTEEDDTNSECAEEIEP